MTRISGFILLPLLLWLTAGAAVAASEDDSYEFDDFPTEKLLQYPDWFKESFYDLQADLKEAVAAGKKGIIVYFGQKRCAYCKQLLEHNFRLDDIVAYTRKHFDVIPIDIWSPEEVTTPDGKTMTKHEYALAMGTNFTPSLVFYDENGRVALRLRGYYPPYLHRAALEYVVGGHYKREPFAVYMARGDKSQHFDDNDLVEEDFFEPPPYNLDRTHFKGERPLAVFFEQGNCHACDVLHTEALRQPAIRKLFAQLDSVQLDMKSDTPVITPDGRKTSAREWAKDLGLFFAPAIIFYDENGKEIIRVDSVVRFFRLRNVLNYILSGGYRYEPDFQKWRTGR